MLFSQDKEQILFIMIKSNCSLFRIKSKFRIKRSQKKSVFSLRGAWLYSEDQHIIFNIWSQNLGQKSKCSKFVISTKSENVNFNYLPPLWAHKPKHFLLWKFFSNSKNLVRMGPKNELFVFLTIFYEPKMSANVINRFFFSKMIFKLASIGSNITAKTLKNK